MNKVLLTVLIIIALFWFLERRSSQTAKNAVSAPAQTQASTGNGTREPVPDYDYKGWIRKLYQEKQFKPLEEECGRLLALFRDRDDDWARTSLIRLYVRLSDKQYMEEINPTNEGIKQVLDEWCQASPQSQVPRIVRGKFMIAYAWEARGIGMANTLTPEMKKLFWERIDLAKKDLEEAYALNPKDPYSSTGLLIIKRAIGAPREEMETCFRNALEADPGNYEARLQMVEALKPKWGGSVDALLEFARKSREAAEKYPRARVIVAKAHEGIQDAYICDGSDTTNEYLSKPKTWEEVSSSFQTYLAVRPWDMWTRFDYVKFAMDAKKYDEALQQMKEIDTYDLSGRKEPLWALATTRVAAYLKSDPSKSAESERYFKKAEALAH